MPYSSYGDRPKDLLLVSTAGRGHSKLGGTATEALPQKLFRYLSEEALQNLPVEEGDGPKHQRMFEQLASFTCMCTYMSCV